MSRIAVFDSGLGSLSIIKEIQNTCKCDIIYFADHKNFPYGTKTKSQLNRIIKNTIHFLNLNFKPELIVLASNTPTILLNIKTQKIIGVRPPIIEASKISKTKHIALLGTNSLIKSETLENYIQNKLSSDVIIHKINATPLIELVESGKFLKNKKYCEKIIKNSLEKKFINNKIDVCMLSSTHLPFLRPMLKSLFKKIKFIDPSIDVARDVCNMIKIKNKKNSLKIYSSIDNKLFQKNLEQLGIYNKINFLEL